VQVESERREGDVRYGSSDFRRSFLAPQAAYTFNPKREIAVSLILPKPSDAVFIPVHVRSQSVCQFHSLSRKCHFGKTAPGTSRIRKRRHRPFMNRYREMRSSEKTDVGGRKIANALIGTR
jgi:hypothetical protein